MNIDVRAATRRDQDCLYRLYGLALRSYIERIWGWDEAWQRQDFDQHFVPEHTQVALVGGNVVAMLQWEERREAIYIRQMAVLPEHQGKGIGRTVLQRVLARAAESGRGAALRVFKINVRARELYERLGFTTDRESDTHYSMCWQPLPNSPHP